MAAPSPLRNLAVFCASADGTKPIYRQAAEELGMALAVRGYGLIYGGAKAGLMQAVADAVLAAGGRVVGVIPEVLVELEVAHQGLTELHVTSTMHTRKALMSERADAFLVLPGGFGTLEELFEVLAWRTLKLHAKSIVLLNIDSFYDGLLAFLDHCVLQGMLKQKNRDFLLVAHTIDQVFDHLEVSEQATSGYREPS